MASPHSTAKTLEKAPAYQWYAKDALTDLELCAMTYEENGMYRTLLDHAWIDGSIPDDLPSLARILRTNLSVIRRAWPRISVKWERVEIDGQSRLVNRRQETERLNQLAWRETLATQGREGARKRWGRRGGAIAGPVTTPSPGHGLANGPQMPLQSASTNTCTALTEGGAADAWQQWREAWQQSGRRPLGIEPKDRKDADHCIRFATRFPDASRRAALLKEFFTTTDREIRKSPPNLGWFLTWADELDVRLRGASSANPLRIPPTNCSHTPRCECEAQCQTLTRRAQDEADRLSSQAEARERKARLGKLL